MNAPQRFAWFTAGLAVVFVAALGAGGAFGRTESTAPDAHDAHPSTATAAVTDSLPGGLMAADHGYTMKPATTRMETGSDVPVSFQIMDPAGMPVTRYVTSHGKQLHLIVVRRDMVGFQHVHPTLDDRGTWNVPLDLTRAGDYRLFADFTPDGGPGLVLGTDLHVAGAYDPRPLPAVIDTFDVDGYTVTLHGDVIPGRASRLTLSVGRDGQSVTDIQPYLGAYGHLVALRADDLAYLHVHPDGQPGDGVTAAGPNIVFHTTIPSAGDYRLFLDFQHDGIVRTAEFTVTATGTPMSQPEPASAGHNH